MKTTALALALLVASIASLPGSARASSHMERRERPTPVTQRSTQTVPAAPGERLRLDLETGANVEISGWDQPSVEVRWELGGRDWSKTRVAVERETGGLLVRAEQERKGSWSTSHKVRVRVPRRFDVDLESSGGSLTIDDVEGRFTGSTGGGELNLTNLRGSANLTTGGGQIQVTDCTLDGRVTTGGGAVTLSRVSGGLRATSGSGPVVRVEGEAGDDAGDAAGVTVSDRGDVEVAPTGPSGRLHVDKAGGEIRLARAPHGAEVTTGGGDVEIGESAGLVEATTGGGDMTIGPVAGSVRASTGAGRVEVTIADAAGKAQTVEVRSGAGEIVVVLPRGFAGSVELETAYTSKHGETRIDAPWELTRTLSDWDDSEGWGEGALRRYVRARGRVGEGSGVLRVKTVNGDVTVRLAD